MSEITNMTALDQSQAMAEGQLSAAELMQATLRQIEKTNPEVNAIVSLRAADDLMAEARAADAAPRKGWMHGLPLAVKDLANAKGLATSMGNPMFAKTIAPNDDLVVARMRAAGAIIIGKTNTPEWGLGSHTFNPVHGATHNPYDLSRSAGGSSGGAAAALAARMVALADGSDMMGSLRNPGAWNNVYGFRPTYGRVPSETEGDTFLHQLATLGPMARTPRDMAALLDTQSGADPRQPHGARYDLTLPGIDASVKGRRIGWLGDWGGAFPMEAGLMAHSEAALPELEALGLSVEPVLPPFSAEAIWESWITLRSWAIAGGLSVFYNDAAKRDQLKPEAIWEIERGLSFSAMDVHRASVIRSQWFKTCASLFERFDALVLPTTQLYPFPVEWTYPEEIAGQGMDTYHRWMQIVTPVGLLGLPCINIPLQMGEKGLPAGLSLFGPRNSDAALMQLGESWHQAYRYAENRPPLA
ncbi:amidase [Lentibacter sp.]|uniref:amidase n=1 Tax=Lentibacter sp. TaxID=2024994 RepID=UPI003F6A13B8